jgi:hypothetical protein
MDARFTHAGSGCMARRRMASADRGRFLISALSRTATGGFQESAQILRTRFLNIYGYIQLYQCSK